jgi:chromosome partitioning protein
VAPVTIHHRVDFAASMIDGRTVGEVDANSRSAKEISALWLYLSDRIQRLKGDADALLFGRKHSFDTELLTPEPASRREMPAAVAAKPVQEEHVPESIDERLQALANEPWDGVERRKLDQEPVPAEQEQRTSEPWDGVERRKIDHGPPLGTPDRRQPPVFGKRGIAQAPASDTIFKRFTA